MLNIKRKSYDELTFADDFMFSKIMMDKEICKEVIETLLQIKIEKIEYINLQQALASTYTAKGVRFDVYVKDSDRVFDVEIQTKIRNDEALRSRYYQSQLDIELLKLGESYASLKESYIIFICLQDPFKYGLPVYTCRTTCLENNKVIDDKMTKMFFNAKEFNSVHDEKTKALLKYIKTGDSESPLAKKIETAVEISKGNEPWRIEYMTFGEMLKDERDEGRIEGALAKAKETARLMILNNIDIDTVSRCTGLSVEEINQLKTNS